MEALVLEGKTYYLEDECDSADMHYVDSASNFAAQFRDGLITPREMLDSLLLLHVEWCNT